MIFRTLQETAKWKSARQKFEDRKDRWRNQIPGADRVHIELWSEGDLLERLVGHPAQRGMEWFFWNKEVFSPDWCAQRIKIAVEAAGERYTPELHVDLPVAFALEGLALSEAYWQRFRTLRGAVVKASNGIEVSCYTGLGITTQLRNLVRSLKKWRREVLRLRGAAEATRSEQPLLDPDPYLPAMTPPNDAYAV